MRIHFEIKPVRLSTIVRGVEDGVVAAGRKIGAAAHAVSVEVKAQQLYAMSRKASKYAEQREVMRRFDELLDKHVGQRAPGSVEG